MPNRTSLALSRRNLVPNRASLARLRSRKRPPSSKRSKIYSGLLTRNQSSKRKSISAKSTSHNAICRSNLRSAPKSWWSPARPAVSKSSKLRSLRQSPLSFSGLGPSLSAAMRACSLVTRRCLNQIATRAIALCTACRGS